MKASNNALRIIKLFEGCKLKSYLCAAGVPTIGWGTTKYPGGTPVKLGEQITQQRADSMLEHEVDQMAASVDLFLMDAPVNQNQFDALVSFAYNCGPTALAKSTLMKKVRNNPNDPTIRDEFMKWTKGGGKVLTGLVRRRKCEADLYFKP